jgi:general secretion pathway protein I
MPTDRQSEAGFTLIEVIVALAIFSLAALAMLRLQGAALGTTARLDEKSVAAIVARNQAIAVLLQPQPPSIGTSSGEEDNGGRRWRWTQTVARSPDPRLQQIEIRVAGPAGDTAASLMLLRSAT